ncbi:recombinase family protein [Flavobacteriaceae bacterium]|nr:recombinase family protein [Flavobacteriaceae bacterium]
MNNLQEKKAILYRRVSTTDQKVFGNSLNAQQGSLRDFCKKNSMNIVKEFQEDYSAKNFNRPEWKRLNAFAKKNKKDIDYLLVVDWDRFSRNAYEALGVINDFKDMGIEVNCIGKWINYNDPAQTMMQLMYLGMPEVDNKIRSQKVQMGMRQGLKEGRWNVMQPIGYVSGKDELGKTLMQLDPIKAPLIKDLFSTFSLGVYSQNEILKMSKFRKLKLYKSTLSRVLRNTLYVGDIKIPAKYDEPEQIVKGRHKPIVSREIFNKVQYLLASRNRNTSKQNKMRDDMYLRGHLKCVKCGGNLTGSASTSKTGAKHYYYHCNRAKGCKESFRVKDAHNELINLFRDLKPPVEVCDLFELVLEDYYKTSKQTQYNDIKRVKSEIEDLELKKDKLLDKLLDEVISDDLFKKHTKNIEKELTEKRNELSNLNDYQKDLSEYINYGLKLMQNLETLFEQSNVNVKNKLLSSIFDEKIEFDGQKYRTPNFKEGFEFIYQKISELQVFKKEKGDKLSNVSHLVHTPLQLSNFFLQDLDSLRDFTLRLNTV